MTHRDKNWTPGPWYKVHTHSDPETAASLAYIANTRRPQIGHELAIIYGCNSDDSQEANAHLIASAPELLEELEDRFAQTACGCGHRSCKRCRDDAETARVIAKAYGETEED